MCFHRFIATRINSGAALEKLQANNIPFAQVEDAATAVIHLACDLEANGEPRRDVSLPI